MPKDKPDVDVVASPSLRADGTPDQTPGFVVIGGEPERPERARREVAARVTRTTAPMERR